MKTKKAASKVLKVVVVGAHPDDCEFQAGGIACLYRQGGHHVTFVSATNGDTGHQALKGRRLAQRRAQEAAQACARIGAASVILPIHNNQLEADVKTRQRFIRLLRRLRPDVLITHRLYDYHPDHRRTGMLIQDASYALRIPNVCPDVAPLQATPLILSMEDAFERPLPFKADVVVDIDPVLATKVEMLHCHSSQVYEWLPWMDRELPSVPRTQARRLSWLMERQQRRNGETARRFRERVIEAYGPQHGAAVACAEAFEVSEYGARLTASNWLDYLPFLSRGLELGGEDVDVV